MSYCPKWVFEATCAAAATEYLSSQLDLNTVASGYAASLSEFYQPIAANEVARAIEPMLRFLDELNAGEDAAPITTGFCYNRITFEQPNKPRKLKGMFGSADEPVKSREYSSEAAFKSFKAYVYSLRNQVVELAPVGWKLAEVEESDVFKKLASQKLSPLDFI
tara:strand:- start:901 stop:1389 length:489 start_codon:yes stop_codon:yes gene_type:complete